MATFQQRHYVALAYVIHREYAETTTASERAAIGNLIAELSRVFTADNPKFDRGRFVAACETGEGITYQPVATLPAPTKWDYISDTERRTLETQTLKPNGEPVPCSGCGTPLRTEADFARHFILRSRQYLNLGECPNRSEVTS